MKKLIELLNEYCKEKKIGQWSILENGYLFHGNKPIRNKKEEFDLLIISNHYGFIKWLVDNDKIDREKFGNSETKSSKYSDFELSYDTPREDYTNTLLMELAIQDEPIRFLIEILR